MGSNSNQRFRFYLIDVTMLGSGSLLEATQSGNEIKVTLIDAATDIVTPARRCKLRRLEAVI